MLDADPVVAGITYLEVDTGQDSLPDYFEVTFQGGSATTRMTQFVINGDQDLSGTLSDGDMFFDANALYPGTGQSHPFQFHAGGSRGVLASDILGATVSDDGMRLTVNVRNFEAGDVLAYTVDVDEVERFRFDKIASGVEFEGTFFNATFVDEHYTFSNRDVNIITPLSEGFDQPQTDGVFFDEYDNLLTTGEGLANHQIDLVRDNEQGHADRTAGAIDAYNLTPKPIEISGNVYHDANVSCERDVDESGIGGVGITLQRFNATSNSYETVASTMTDNNGHYVFGKDLGLMPGKFRIIEAQPSGYLDVAATAGTVNGIVVGTVSNPNVLSEINIPLGGDVASNYDFTEVLPATLAGNVYHDRNDNGIMNSGEEGIANVLIRVTRIGAADADMYDPFADTTPIFVRTDANGHYEVTGLPPGVYQVTEINNYPPGQNPLATYIDGKDTIGTIRSQTVGNKVNDAFNSITLCADEDGVEYNFGELRPASIGGYVSIATPEGECLDPTDPHHRGISGVNIQLFDLTGKLVASTTTDANGHYEFNNLTPGTYSVVEVQPDGYLDGEETVGKVGTTSVGLTPVNDRFVGIGLQSGNAGTNYNFCEHLPASVKGHVWHDLNDNGVKESGEKGIAGTVIQLFDANGDMVAETVTDADGRYGFEDLYAGQYKIVEVQPGAYIDGKESLGSVAGHLVGEVQNDVFSLVNLLEGEQGDNYNFGEILAGSIAGTVHADVNGDCVFDPSQGDIPLANVDLQLLNSQGSVVATTKTDANGNYSFGNLRPGTYSVREVQPDGYLDGEEMVGTVAGSSVGSLANDLLSGIVLTSGQNAIDYDFCEHIPAQLKGTVWFDVNNDGAMNNSEKGIAGVTIRLYDINDNIVAELVTDADGRYSFENLIAGEYKVREIQPGDYVDGKESIGRVGSSVNGEVQNDQFSKIILRGGQTGENYDFGEIRLASIAGYVHLDPDGNCVFDTSKGDKPLGGVTMQLLGGDGQVLNTTLTDANGHYLFENLLPGVYSIRQIQPGGLFTTGESVGTGTGIADTNIISNIHVDSGQHVTQYNFCEQAAAEIHGRVWEDGPAFESESGQVPDGYRSQRDGVYQTGVDTPIAGVRMELWYYVDPTNLSIAPRRVTLGEVLNSNGEYDHLGSDSNSAVWVETMADGQYWFTGLQAGNYIVLEAQPTGFIDANDTPGSTSGFSYNSEVEAALAPSILVSTFSGTQLMDSIVNIRVNSGDVSSLNNFSEVRALSTPDTPFLPPPNPPQAPPNPVTPLPPLGPGFGLAGHQSANFTAYIGGGRGVSVDALPAVAQYTWHLSVVNAGQPRGGESDSNSTSWLQASYLSDQDWNRFDMQAGEWNFSTTSEDGTISIRNEESYFGMIDGTPISGDFDGDGDDEVVVYKDGYWMIDLNGNGRWDIDDLMARLGDQTDRPVVGDWDGDGKDDIGIFGPIWEGDHEAIEADPGIPDPANLAGTRPKNLPPEIVQAAEGSRAMRLSSFGNSRIDVIDHVFGYGNEEDVPVTGDWNGDAIRTIGMFRDGNWQVDLNGDGQFDHNDDQFSFGRAGDIPLIGDFNGDGIEEVAVFRNGTWIIDTNGNREIDATDKVFEMGGRGDLPVVGDWDGDGVDEPATYHAGGTQATSL